MTAEDYPVAFGYGATDETFYYTPTASHPITSNWVGTMHRGNDRYCPIGTKVNISGVLCAYTGATGKVGGPHLHTQAGTDLLCQNTFDPSKLDFKPGTVVALSRQNIGQWGKYFTLKIDNNYITYAHLNEVVVNIGDIIGEPMIEGKEDHYQFANKLHQRIRGRDMSRKDFEGWIGKTWLKYDEALIYDKEADQTYDTLQLGKLAKQDNWHQQILDRDQWIKDLNDALNNIDTDNKQKLEEIKKIVNK